MLKLQGIASVRLMIPLDLLLQRPLDCLFLVLPQPHGHFTSAAIEPGVIWDGREGLWAKLKVRAVGAASNPMACPWTTR
jgi:hypothetical protein